MERISVWKLKMIFDHPPIGQPNECGRVCKKWQHSIDRLISFDFLLANELAWSVHFVGFDKLCRELRQAIRELKERSKQNEIYLNGLQIDRFRELLNSGGLVKSTDLQDFYLSSSSTHSMWWTINRPRSLTEVRGDLFGLRRPPRLKVVAITKQPTFGLGGQVLGFGLRFSSDAAFRKTFLLAYC